MSYSQEVYDAACQQMRGDYAGLFEQAVSRAFDFSHLAAMVAEDWSVAAGEQARPSAVYRPSICRDGNAWCALYGENIQDGVAGFGDSPAKAMAAFDKAWTATKGGE